MSARRHFRDGSRDASASGTQIPSDPSAVIRAAAKTPWFWGAGVALLAIAAVAAGVGAFLARGGRSTPTEPTQTAAPPPATQPSAAERVAPPTSAPPNAAPAAPSSAGWRRGRIVGTAAGERAPAARTRSRTTANGPRDRRDPRAQQAGLQRRTDSRVRRLGGRAAAGGCESQAGESSERPGARRPAPNHRRLSELALPAAEAAFPGSRRSRKGRPHGSTPWRRSSSSSNPVRRDQARRRKQTAPRADPGAARRPGAIVAGAPVDERGGARVSRHAAARAGAESEDCGWKPSARTFAKLIRC